MVIFDSYVNDNDPGCSPKAWRHTVHNPVAEHQNMVAGKIPPNMWTYLLKIGVACVASKKKKYKLYVNRIIKHSTLRYDVPKESSLCQHGNICILPCADSTPNFTCF